MRDFLEIQSKLKQLSPKKQDQVERRSLFEGGRRLRKNLRGLVRKELGHPLSKYSRNVQFAEMNQDSLGDFAYTLNTKGQKINARFGRPKLLNAAGKRKSSRSRNFKASAVEIQTFGKKQVIPRGFILPSGRVARRKGDQVKGVYLPGPIDVMRSKQSKPAIDGAANDALQQAKNRMIHHIHHALSK